MNRFFQNLLGTKSNQVRRTRQQRCQDTVKPQIEALEGRMLLAARITPMAIVAPVVQVQPATALRSIHPGTSVPRLVGPVLTMVQVESNGEGRLDESCGLWGDIAQELLDTSDDAAEAGDFEASFDSARAAHNIINSIVSEGCVVILD
jgi:hypothetical protein